MHLSTYEQQVKLSENKLIISVIYRLSSCTEKVLHMHQRKIFTLLFNSITCFILYFKENSLFLKKQLTKMNKEFLIIKRLHGYLISSSNEKSNVKL